MARMDALARDVTELKAARGPASNWKTGAGAPPRRTTATEVGGNNGRDKKGGGDREIYDSAKACYQHVPN